MEGIDVDEYDDDDGYDDWELRRRPRANRKTYVAEQAHKDEQQGGAGSSKPLDLFSRDPPMKGSLDPFLYRT